MLNSQVSGTGMPVVLIHGFAENLCLWQGLVPSLAENYQVIALDLPGFGQSPALPPPFTLDQVAEKVHQHLQKIYHLNQYVVLGHSLGGYISLALAELFPQNIAGLGLINSTAYADSAEKKGLRDKTVAFINKNGPAFFLESFVPNLFAEGNRQKLANEIAMVLAMGKNLTAATLTSYMQAMRNRPDRSGVLPTRETVFIAGGLHDQHVPYKDVEKLIALLQKPNHGHIYQNVAHMSMMEAKNALKNDLLIFLKEIKT